MVNPKIITCAGYYGTGSSAITDLLGEFSNVHFLGDYEFRFIQDPGGIADLDYNIVENYHRHNSGHALKRYKKNIDFLVGNRFNKTYEKTFNGQFKALTMEYIESLTAFKFKGYWHQDVIDRGFFFWFIERALDKILNRVIVPIIRGRKNIEPISIHLLRNEITYVPYSDKPSFYEKTRAYTSKLFKIANVENKEFVMVDQLVPPSNTEKYLRYFDDLIIFAIDRDPRDIYLLERFVYKGGVVPIENIKDFCTWYRLTREHRKYEHDDPCRVMRLYFEDLIYHYDETIGTICKFLNIDPTLHVAPKSKLIPERSVENTQMWKRHPELSEEMRYIKENLAEYCYKRF
jgi:hypothetical protein